LTLSLQGIAAATVRELRETVQQMQADLLNRQIDPLVLQVQLYGLYAQLLGKGITLQLDQLALQTADGGLQGNGSLTLLGIPAGPTGLNLDQLNGGLVLTIDPGAFASGFRLLDKLRHQGRASAIPAVLNEQAEQLAGGLLQRGVLTKNPPGGYRIELRVEQGLGQLNGRPFNP